MAQHFLLSAKARTLSLKEIFKGGETAAYETFKRFIVPIANYVPRIEFLYAAGMMLIVALFRNVRRVKDDEDKSNADHIADAIAFGFVMPGILLLVGWALTWFL